MTENYYEMKDGAKVYVGSRLGHGQCIEFLLAGGVVDAKYSYAAPISADESFTVSADGRRVVYTPWRTDTGNVPRLPITDSHGWLHNIGNICGEGWHACHVKELPPSVAASDSAAPEIARGIDYKAINEQLRKDLDCVTRVLSQGIYYCHDANDPVEAAELAVKCVHNLTRADQHKPDDFQVMIRKLEDMAYTSVVARDILRQIRSTSDYATYLRIILGLLEMNYSLMQDLLQSRMREAPPSHAGNGYNV